MNTNCFKFQCAITSIAIAMLVSASVSNADKLTLHDYTMHEAELISIHDGQAEMRIDGRLETKPLGDIRTLQIARPALLTSRDDTESEVELISIHDGQVELRIDGLAQSKPVTDIYLLKIVTPGMTSQKKRTTITRDDTVEQPTANTFANVADFINNSAQLLGQRVTVTGLVSEAVVGMPSEGDWYMLDGKLLCRFRLGSHCTEGASKETRRTVSITGTVVIDRNHLGRPILVNCDCPGSGMSHHRRLK